MEQKNRKIEDFKLSLVKNVEEAIKNGLDAEDIIGTIENVKMITFRLCTVDPPMQDRDDNALIGYR